MVNKSIKKLKITVTNIKSVLVNDSKKLSKVKVVGKRLEYNKLQLLKREKKEENVEKMKKSSPLAGASKKVGSVIKKPMDMFMGTLGLLGTGVLVNTLPFLINKLKNAFDEVKKKFDQLNSVIDKILGFINAITEPSKNLFNIFNKKDTSENSELESNVADDSVIEGVEGVEGDGDNSEMSLGIDVNTGENQLNNNQEDTKSKSISPSSFPKLKNIIKPKDLTSKIDKSLEMINQEMDTEKEKIVIIQRQVVEVLT